MGCAAALTAALAAATCGCMPMAQTGAPEAQALPDRPEATQTAGSQDSGSSADLPDTRTLSVSARVACLDALAKIMDPALATTLTVEATRERQLRAYIDLAPGASFPDDEHIFVLFDSILSRSKRSREVYVSFMRPEPDGSVRLLFSEWKAYPGELTVSGATAPSVGSLDIEFIDSEDRVITDLTRKRISQIAAGNEPVPH